MTFRPEVPALGPASLRVALAGTEQPLARAVAHLVATPGAHLLICGSEAEPLGALCQALEARGARVEALAADLATDAGAQAFASACTAAPGGVELALLFSPTGAAPASGGAARDTSRAGLLEALLRSAVTPALAANALLRRWADANGEASGGRRGSLAGTDRHLLLVSSTAASSRGGSGTGPREAALAALQAWVRALAEESWPWARVNHLTVPVAAGSEAGGPLGEPPSEAVARLARAVLTAAALPGARPVGGGLSGQSGRCLDGEALAQEGSVGARGSGQLAFALPLQPPPSAEVELPEEPLPGRRAPPRVRSAFRGAAPDLHRYPRSAGDLARRLAQLHRVEPDAILLSGAGSTELLERALRALCAPEDEVASPFPCWELLPVLCARERLRHRPVARPRLADGLFGPLAAAPLLAAIGPRTRLVYVATPDNPTGDALPLEEERILVAGLGPGVALLVDEAWSLHPPGSGPGEGPSPALRLRSFSKLLGLAGLRLGYAIAPPALAEVLRRLELPYPVGEPQARAALAALDESPRFRRAALLLLRERARLAGGLAALGLTVSQGSAALLLVRDGRPGARVAPILFSLRAASVPVQEAEWDPAAFTIGVGPPAQTRAALGAVKRALQP